MYLFILGGTNDVHGCLSDLTLERLNHLDTITKLEDYNILISGGNRFSPDYFHCELVEIYLKSKYDIVPFHKFYENNDTIDEAMNLLSFCESRKINDVHIITSDWHIDRVKFIFESIFKNTTYTLRFDSCKSKYYSNMIQDETNKLNQLKTKPFGKFEFYLKYPLSL